MPEPGNPKAKDISGLLLMRLIAGHVSLHACMAALRMAAPLLALRQGYSPLAVGVLMALFALTQVFLAIPAGRYADRHGMRKPVGWSVTVAVFGATLAVAFPVFPVLCFAALCSGGATGAAVIALQREVGRSAHTAAELKRMFSWLSIGPAFSNFIGPMCAGLLIDHAGVWFGGEPGDLAGFRVTFLMTALLPLIAWWGVQRAPRHGGEARAAQGTRRAWDLLRDRGMRRLLLVNWLLSACWDVHTFVMPVLGHERGFSASTIGILLGSFAAAAAGVRLLMPLIAERLREQTIVGRAMVATAILFGLYPLMPGPWSMGACSVLLGVTLGSVQPLIMSLLHQITPEHRQGEALGLRLMTINASSVAMPLVFGGVGAVVGVSLVFWVAGAAVGWGSRTALRMKSQERFRSSRL